MAKNGSMLDAIDRGLIHALHIDGRVPYARIAAALGVSTQTVARRYRKLRGTVALRVVGLPDPHRAGQAQWLVRLTAVPHQAQNVADALARRNDTSWVKLASGGTEIVAIIHTPTGATASSHSLLLRDIPRTASVTSVSAHYVLHTYFGGPMAWRGRTGALDEKQQALLRPAAPTPGGDAAITDADGPLLATLQHDGRAGNAELAAATGWTPAAVARRLAELRASGALYFDVELDVAVFGAGTQALLWMAVAPAQLERIATTLAGHEELAFVGATTGPTNLVAQALCPDPASLHRYLTHRLGALDAIHTLETAPVLRTIKAAGPLVTYPAGPGRPR